MFARPKQGLIAGIVIATIPAFLFAQPKSTAAVREQVAINPIFAIYDSGRAANVKRTDKRVTFESAPVVRANGRWTLVVELIPPVAAGVEIEVRARGAGESVELGARRMSATVTEAAAPCNRCAVALAWRIEGLDERAPLPAIRYRAVAVPAVRSREKP